jgi:hypothetical protein
MFGATHLYFLGFTSLQIVRCFRQAGSTVPEKRARKYICLNQIFDTTPFSILIFISAIDIKQMKLSKTVNGNATNTNYDLRKFAVVA